MDEPGIYVHAYHRDGSEVAGFPVLMDGEVDTFPAIGDVDGDGDPEIVLMASQGITSFVKVLAADGTVERTMTAVGDVAYGTAPALGDLDGDGVPEIVVQTDDALNVWKGNGTIFPGWPRTWTNSWQGSSAPVIGDVDGDGQPDIAITKQVAGSSEFGEVRLYDRNGVLNSHFPKQLELGAGGVPAIADLDLDGRNELVVLGSAWSGFEGLYDKVWVYDLHGSSYGGIEWGQFGGNARHTGLYGAASVRLRLRLRRHRRRRHRHRRHRLRLRLRLRHRHRHRLTATSTATSTSAASTASATAAAGAALRRPARDR